MKRDYNNVGALIDYESGLLSEAQSIELFSYLIKSGLAWKLQGSYGRTAKALIEAGVIDNGGRIIA